MKEEQPEREEEGGDNTRHYRRLAFALLLLVSRRLPNSYVFITKNFCKLRLRVPMTLPNAIYAFASALLA